MKLKTFVGISHTVAGGRGIVGDKINVIRVDNLRGFSYILLVVFVVKKRWSADII